MLFSILVPVYQVEQYLPECLRSIENQFCQDFEVILVDDGSKDNSGAICDAFAQKHPGRVTVIHKENEGLISARRIGIQTAKGRYCIFLDSDDMLEPACLKVLQEKLIRFDYPDLVKYSFSYYDNGKCSPCRYQDFGPDRIYAGKEKQILYRSLLEGPALSAIWAKAIKTELLQRDDTDYRQYYGKNMAEDLLQSLYPVTYAERVLCISEPLYLYRYNRESVSRSFCLETAYRKNMIHVYWAIQSYLPQWGLDTPEARDRLHARWLNETVYYMEKYFVAASGVKNRLAVLRYSWSEFVDMSRETPDCAATRTAHIWKLYTGRKLLRLYLELTAADWRRALKHWKRERFGANNG